MGATTSGDACIYVIGMHRSGTSAVTGLLGALGVGMPRPEDLVPASDDNEEGHWESRSVVQINGQVFRHLGGTLFAPPLAPPGWQHDTSLDDVRHVATARFAASFGPRPMAVKDPRCCITLPFWQTVIEPPAVAVFVFRHPVEVARSLQARNQLPVLHGLALWERYVRSAADNLNGLPTFAADYGRVLEDPALWSGELVRFLHEVGLSIDPEHEREAAGRLRPDLRHHHRPPDPDPGPAAGAELVFQSLRRLQGPHAKWEPPDLGPEPMWVGEVLALTRELEELRVAHASLRRSRGVRLVTAMWRARQRPRPPADD
jgi:hypothetical protein